MLWQVATAVFTLFLGAIGNHLWESRRRIRFVAADWKFQYLEHDTEAGRRWNDKTERETAEDKVQGSKVRYLFTVKIFNEKSEATGLHDFSVEFMKGKGFQQELLFQHDDLRDASVPVSPGYGSPRLGELQLPSREWVVAQIVGYPGWRLNLRDTDSVWFVARSPSGKRFRRKVTDIFHRLGLPRRS